MEQSPSPCQRCGLNSQTYAPGPNPPVQHLCIACATVHLHSRVCLHTCDCTLLFQLSSSTSRIEIDRTRSDTAAAASMPRGTRIVPCTAAATCTAVACCVQTVVCAMPHGRSVAYACVLSSCKTYFNAEPGQIVYSECPMVKGQRTAMSCAYRLDCWWWLSKSLTLCVTHTVNVVE